MTCIIDLMRTIDRSRFEPLVLFYHRNRHEQDLQEMGIETRCLDLPLSGEEDGEGAGPSRPKKHATGLKRAVKRHPIWRETSKAVRESLPWARRIADIIGRESIDLVHNNDNPRGDRASILAAHLCRVPQVSLIRYTPSYYRPLDARLARYSERLVAVSRYARDHFVENVGRVSTPIEVVYDPVHLDVLDQARAATALSREDLGLDASDFVVTNVGRITWWKGQLVFLDAVRTVANHHPDIRALIVGAPTDAAESQAFWAQLREKVDALDLSPFVRFLGYRSDIQAVMAQSDLVVHTAIRPEPFGKVIVEAMAAQRPVVATAFGGPMEIVEPETTGLLVPAGDPDALAEAIGKLAADRERSRRMGEAGRRLVQERFPVDRFRQAMHRIWAEALAARR
jgi:glycosyltransferase involved in cell wall biosynthesis